MAVSDQFLWLKWGGKENYSRCPFLFFNILGNVWMMGKKKQKKKKRIQIIKTIWAMKLIIEKVWVIFPLSTAFRNIVFWLATQLCMFTNQGLRTFFLNFNSLYKMYLCTRCGIQLLFCAISNIVPISRLFLFEWLSWYSSYKLRSTLKTLHVEALQF